MSKVNIIKCQSVKNSDTNTVEKVYVFADNWAGREGKIVGMPFNVNSIKEARIEAKLKYSKELIN